MRTTAPRTIRRVDQDGGGGGGMADGFHGGVSCLGLGEAEQDVDPTSATGEAVPGDRIAEMVVGEVDRDRLGCGRGGVAGPRSSDEDDGSERLPDRAADRRQVPAEPAAPLPGRWPGVKPGPLAVAAPARDARQLTALRLRGRPASRAAAGARAASRGRPAGSRPSSSWSGVDQLAAGSPSSAREAEARRRSCRIAAGGRDVAEVERRARSAGGARATGGAEAAPGGGDQLLLPRQPLQLPGAERSSQHHDADEGGQGRRRAAGGTAAAARSAPASNSCRRCLYWSAISRPLSGRIRPRQRRSASGSQTRRCSQTGQP